MRAPMARICEGLLGALELKAELEARSALAAERTIITTAWVSTSKK
jgi:hypothetical protein